MNNNSGYKIWAYDLNKKQAVTPRTLAKVSLWICAVILFILPFILMFTAKITLAPIMVMELMAFLMFILALILNVNDYTLYGPYLGRMWVAGTNSNSQLYIFDIGSAEFKEYMDAGDWNMTINSARHRNSYIMRSEIPSVVAKMDAIHRGIYDRKKIEKAFNDHLEDRIGMRVEGVSNFFAILDFSTCIITWSRNGETKKERVYFYNSIDDYMELKDYLRNMSR